MYLGSRFENGLLCGANGPNRNGWYLINIKGGGSRRGGYSPGQGRLETVIQPDVLHQTAQRVALGGGDLYLDQRG